MRISHVPVLVLPNIEVPLHFVHEWLSGECCHAPVFQSLLLDVLRQFLHILDLELIEKRLPLWFLTLLDIQAIPAMFSLIFQVYVRSSPQIPCLVFDMLLEHLTHPMVPNSLVCPHQILITPSVSLQHTQNIRLFYSYTL